MTVEAQPPQGADDPARSPISRVELVALLAMLSATVAFSIDAMLPALPEIGADLSPADPNRAQLVVAAFVAALGLGTLFAGPLSDALGRRPVAVGGAVVYTLAALYAATSDGLTELLIARAVQGLGAAGPRVVALALVRDLFSGRQMARIVSFVMIVFTLVPVIAPTMGAAIQWVFGWRAIFLSFALFSVISMLWLMIRQPETLPPERRRPFRVGLLVSGVREVLSNRQVVLAICAQTMIFAMLFSALLSAQPVFERVFDKNSSFPAWFGLMAAISASSSLINAMIVVRLGMKTVVKWAIAMQIGVSLGFLGYQLVIGIEAVPAFFVAFLWLTSVFYMAGLGIGNMNAIAMEPMGHIAGMASSVIGASATIASMVFAVPIGLGFNGTMIPLTGGVMVLSLVALGLVLMLKDTGGEIEIPPTPLARRG